MKTRQPEIFAISQCLTSWVSSTSKQFRLLILLSYLLHIPYTDATHTSDVSSTTTPSTVQSRKEREEAEDDFHHHPSIIVGLLGFCAICGLLSAGMTLVNRGKQAKHRSFSSICSRVLFDSGTSLITTLDEGCVTHLGAVNGQAAKSSMIAVRALENHGNLAVNRDQSGQAEKTKSELDRCFGQICPVRKHKKINKMKCPKSSSTDPSLQADKVTAKPTETESEDRKAKESCASSGHREPTGVLEANFMEAFDRATGPINYSTCASSGRHEPPLAQRPDELSRTLLRRKVQSGELVSRVSESMSRSNAASFGHLPNTIVFPVEKLSDIVYHCGILPPGSTLNRTPWNRSGPLPLVNERDSKFSEDYLRDTLKTAKSGENNAKNFFANGMIFYLPPVNK